jgi:peptidoglycan/xylan/chitin deacetylase (PgdA/CDA1 family)
MSLLHVVITMDCERPNDTGLPGVTGPKTWADSARFIQRYAEIVRNAGFPVSFFMHPEVTSPHRDLFFALERAGCSIAGLHLHPWKYSSVQVRQHLGLMDEDAQRSVLATAVDEWSQGLGRAPRYFRPGTFSASDSTFRVAVDAGFVGGSLSVPGRVYPEIGAVWSGCPADPHLADGAFRIRPGRLHFANMPLTVDFSETRRRGQRQWHPDLRPDQSYVDLDKQVASVVNQILSRRPAIPVLNVVTHNDNNYADQDNPVRRNLEAILAATKAAAADAGAECRGATIDEICDMVFALDAPAPEFVPV